MTYNHTNEDAWIELLNDLSVSDDQYRMGDGSVYQNALSLNDEVFVTESGEVTDHFLEAVKADLKIIPSRLYKEDAGSLKNGDSLDSRVEIYRQKKKTLSSPLPSRLETTTHRRKFKSTIQNIVTSDPVIFANETSSSSARKIDRDSFKENINDSTVDVDSDPKIKSLQLRLKGQLECIRSLEQKLRRAQDLLSSRSKQINDLQTKLKAVSQIYHRRPDGAISPPQSIDHSQQIEEIVNHYKKQLEILEGKLLDEVNRRHRAEERAKTMKDFVEKLKLRCSELEAANKGLIDSQSSLQAKLERYRRSYRDSAEEVNARDQMMIRKENEIAELVARARNTEKELATKEIVLEETREEIANLRFQLKQQSNEMRNLQMRLGIRQDKDINHRIQNSLLNIRPEQNQPELGRPRVSDKLSRSWSEVEDESVDLKQKKQRNLNMEWKDLVVCSLQPNQKLLQKLSMIGDDLRDPEETSKVIEALPTRPAEDFPEEEKNQTSTLHDPTLVQTAIQPKTSVLVKEMITRRKTTSSSPLTLRAYESELNLSTVSGSSNNHPNDDKIHRLQRIYEKVASK